MQLLLDPDVDAVLHDGIDLARPRPEGEPVQRMQRALAIVEFVIGSGAGDQNERDHSGEDFRREVHEPFDEFDGRDVYRDLLIFSASLVSSWSSN